MPAFGLVRTHLAAPGVAGERGELGARHPFERLEGKAGRVAAGIAVPASGLEAALHLAGAHDHVVAALDGDALRLRGVVEILAGDAVAVLERLLAQRARARRGTRRGRPSCSWSSRCRISARRPTSPRGSRSRSTCSSHRRCGRARPIACRIAAASSPCRRRRGCRACRARRNRRRCRCAAWCGSGWCGPSPDSCSWRPAGRYDRN